MNNTNVKHIINARLPMWLLPINWPASNTGPSLAKISIDNGKVSEIKPSLLNEDEDIHTLDCKGNLCLPALIEAHTHLDKTYTRHRLGHIKPGLLNAILAMEKDKEIWDFEDIYQRANLAISEANHYGVKYLRTHIDWDSGDAPSSWKVISQLSEEWRSKINIELVALLPITEFSDPVAAEKIAIQVKHISNGVLGAFIHSSNFEFSGLKNLLLIANKYHLNLDLHIDEELTEQPEGLIALLNILETMSFHGRIVCSHLCALSSCEPALADNLLHRVAAQPISIVALPTTNLLLQDSCAEHTPKLRGITLIKEAKRLNIPVLIGADNVQDAFCHFGAYDPISSLNIATYAAQLESPFDTWSESICRSDILQDNIIHPFNLIGKDANFIFFETTNVWDWPNKRERHLTFNLESFKTNNVLFQE